MTDWPSCLPPEWGDRFERAPYDWIALREAYRASLHFPLQLHKGHHRYEVLTVDAAITWAEHRARFWLD